MKFNDDMKKEYSNDYFGWGVHRVLIGEVENGGTEEGEKEYVEVTVMDPDNGDITDKARVWFTTEAAQLYSFNTLRNIYVHNAPEAKKEAARKEFDAVGDTTELCALMNLRLIGKECWFTKYPDPKRTYVGQDGVTRKSVNKNVLGYEPKVDERLMPRSDDKDALNETFPGAEKATGDAVANIPGDDDWDK